MHLLRVLLVLVSIWNVIYLFFIPIIRTLYWLE